MLDIHDNRSSTGRQGELWIPGKASEKQPGFPSALAGNIPGRCKGRDLRVSHKHLGHPWDGLAADSWKSHLIPWCLSFPPQKMDHPSHLPVPREMCHMCGAHAQRSQALILSGALRSHYKRNKVQHLVFSWKVADWMERSDFKVPLLTAVQGNQGYSYQS